MDTWLLKKIREKYFIHYTISNKIKIVKKDYTDFHYIFDYYKESTYSLLYDEFIGKWWYPKAIKSNFIDNLYLRDTIRNNKRSLLMQKEAKENWVKITKTQHSEQDLEK